MLFMIFRWEELGEKRSQGGTKITLAHWTGRRLFGAEPLPPSRSMDHHLIIKPFSEKATKP
jgi:hypothetical protein